MVRISHIICPHAHDMTTSTAYFYRTHAADVFPMAHNTPASSTFGAFAGLPPAPEQHLDILDYLSSDESGPPAVPGTFGTPPPPMSVEPLVPVAAGYGAYPRASAEMARDAARTDKIAFRTRSEEEVLDDGYKWRKYGKKSVKNSPNPRNYYRCSTEGCSVKKRVERDRDDPCYVVTTYDGIHNHASPGTVYYAAQDAASGRFFVAGMHIA